MTTVVHHVVGPAETIERAWGMRLDTDANASDLPERVLIETLHDPQWVQVIGSTRDGWPVVADPDPVIHPVFGRHCRRHLNG